MKFNNLKNYLNLRFPAMTTYGAAILLSVSGTAIVMLFFMFFQPFGMHSIEGSYRLLTMGLFALPYFPFILIYCCLVVFLIKLKNYEMKWLLKHEIISNGLLVLIIGIVNFFLLVPVMDKQYSLITFFDIIAITVAVMLFPIVVLMGIDLIRFQYREKLISALKNEYSTDSIVGERNKDQTIMLLGLNKDESIELNPDKLLFIQSQGNYVEIVEETGSNQLNKEILRTSLKNIESQLSENPNIQQVHRSFLVNISRIEGARGNAHGMLFSLGASKIHIPVSRKFVNAAKEYAKR